jgi:hypothetical protein
MWRHCGSSFSKASKTAGRQQRQSTKGVRAENPVQGCEQQSCSTGSPAVMITDHVPAVVFLLITQVSRWPRLSRRADAWKTAEILILRHQVAIMQRHQARRPKLAWADRALLATLLGVIPRARRQWLRLLVTPDTIMRWHRGIVRRRGAVRSRRGRSGRRPAGISRPWSCGWLGRTPSGATGGFTVSWPAWEFRSQHRR